jgi:transposase InsO family protein
VKPYRHNRPYSPREKEKALKLLKNSTIEYVCHRYHCSERTLYRWKKAYDGTLESLANKSSKPKTPHPNSHTKDEIKHIQDLMRRNPQISLNELYGKLRTNYAYTRHPSSLYRFLRKNHFFKETRKVTPYKPKPYDTPITIGEKMQLDVKYVPRECRGTQILADRNFYQYTIIDECTRERFIYAYEEQIADNTIDFLKRAFIYFGYKPKMIQTDNGSEFTYTRQTKRGQRHKLDIFCEQNNIIHKTIKPRTPRHNGKVERSHRCDNERFYKYLKFYSYKDLQNQMRAYLKRSNNIPTSVLNWKSPKEARREHLLKDWGVVE